MKTDASPFYPLLRNCQTRVEEALDRWLPDAHIPPTRLHEAMRYGVLGAGKRVRPFLVYATGLALGVDIERLDGPACAVELIHCYSLIHDDLPAMDNDDLRRGRPTCHKAFDEATALLAGDALQTLAFYILAHDPKIEDSTRSQMIERLALASGSRGMAGGQAIDLASVGQRLSLLELENMHIHKTGALIRSSVMLGALCKTGGSPEILRRLDRYAKCIGLAFQIQDDVLDVEGSTKNLGKRRGQDAMLNKPTYPSLLGLKGAKAKAKALQQEAIQSIEPLDNQAETLREIATYIVERSH